MDYNTPLSQAETRSYHLWAKAQGKDPTMEEQNYDLRGFFKENGPVNLKNGQHATDKYKKPNHPTFSNESIYSNRMTPGGEWSELDNGKWSFKPSSTNLKYHGENGLRDYFKQSEPDSLLIIPKEPTLF